jgi:hypothetical protein
MDTPTTTPTITPTTTMTNSQTILSDDTYFNTLPYELIYEMTKHMSIDQVIYYSMALNEPNILRDYKITINVCHSNCIDEPFTRYMYKDETQEYKNIFDEMLLQGNIILNLNSDSLEYIIPTLAVMEPNHWKFLELDLSEEHVNNLLIDYPSIQSSNGPNPNEVAAIIEDAQFINIINAYNNIDRHDNLNRIARNEAAYRMNVEYHPEVQDRNNNDLFMPYNNPTIPFSEELINRQMDRFSRNIRSGSRLMVFKIILLKICVIKTSLLINRMEERY